MRIHFYLRILKALLHCPPASGHLLTSRVILTPDPHVSPDPESLAIWLCCQDSKTSSGASAGSFSLSGLGFQKLFQSGILGPTPPGQLGDVSLIISFPLLSLASFWNHYYLHIRFLRTDPLISLSLAIFCFYFLEESLNFISKSLYQPSSFVLQELFLFLECSNFSLFLPCRCVPSLLSPSMLITGFLNFTLAHFTVFPPLPFFCML